MKQVLILSSANGSNFEAIIKYFKKRDDINFSLLCDNKNARVIKRAKKLKIKTFVIEKKEEIKSFLINNKFDLVVMAGFFKILDNDTIKSNCFINIHPSLLPKFKGLGAIKKAYNDKEEKTGITIHYADEFLDSGEIIYQKELLINKNWTFSHLEKEIHKLEHFYYPRVIEKLLKVNVLVIGGGAREHTIAEKISQSKFLNKLYLADSNDGFKDLGEVIKYKNYSDLAIKAKEKNINLAIIGPEKYLVEGLVDILNKQGIKTIGADKKTAQLEGSKLYAKKLMKKYKINTANYKKINNKKDIDKFLKLFKSPVIKADGLAAGKGVYLGDDIKNELIKFLDGKFSASSKTSLIEEKLNGNEASMFSFWDGENLLNFPLCRDYKKSPDGFNTGGLGAICPTEEEGDLDEYKNKLKTMLQKEKIKTPFIIYSGLIFQDNTPYVLEYNVRLGDPETQVLLNYIKNDWLDIFYSCANKMLNFINLEFLKPQTCVVVASKGYPRGFKTGVEIKNINKEIKTYYSGVTKKEDKIFNSAGRVLSFVSDDKKVIYKAIQELDFSEKMYRDDI